MLPLPQVKPRCPMMHSHLPCKLRPVSSTQSPSSTGDSTMFTLRSGPIIARHHNYNVPRSTDWSWQRPTPPFEDSRDCCPMAALPGDLVFWSLAACNQLVCEFAEVLALWLPSLRLHCSRRTDAAQLLTFFLFQSNPRISELHSPESNT